MSSFTPYTYFQCPCSSNTHPHRIGDSTPTSPTSSDSDEEHTFDPRTPRANYSLYPLEHLLYCEDCHQIRCPRCVLDEIVTWYCPNCLFEVPSSTVKGEGNRCTRSCFQCPICIAPLSISSLEAPPEGLGAEYATQSGPYVLNCSYCTWSSKEIGIVFEKSNGLFSQLAKLQNGGGVKISPKERRKDRDERMREISSPMGTTISGERPETETETGMLDPNEKWDAESQFYNLKTFYQSQLADTSGGGVLGFSGDYGYGSPAALSRIMGMYTSGSFSDKRSKHKNSSMREAADSTEGLHILSPSTDTSLISKLQSSGWESTTSIPQRSEQFHDPKFLDALRPIPTLLRTKRSKRCRTCRHILSKPESKVQTTRFRIRLVAINYIPSLVIKPLSSPSPSSSALLVPHKPIQYLLTFKNPLFEAIKVNIATPAKTPGRFGSKVTILCPQFEVGANTDMWDEALGEGKAGEREKDRRKEVKESSGSEGLKQAEAGKVWERGRNWVSVVVEVVPCSLRVDGPEFLKRKKGDEGVREDEDIIEIPVFVRVEWEAEGAQDEGGLGAKGEREKRELAYWCVLGVGRIARD